MPLIPHLGTDGTFSNPAHTSDPVHDAPDVYTSTQWATFTETRSLHPVLAPRALGDVDATIAMADHQRFTIRVLATSVSAVSLASALLAVYWFYMMRRNFRRDLVLLLILGGSWKTLWFLSFSAVTFYQGSVASGSAFCQASGYFLLVGFESCDIAIVLMSMHMCLQIFPSAKGIFGHDGLYPVRKWVLAIWLILPHIIASLAFINEHGGYVSQGPFCFLPVRPFWYRLALFWIPRYLIWIYISYVAIRIYRHVGTEFKVFGQERDRSSSINMPGQSSIDRARQRDEMKRRASMPNGALSDEKSSSNEGRDSCAPDDMSCRVPQPSHSPKSMDGSRTGKEGAPSWSVSNFGGDSGLGTQASRSMPTSRRGSKMLAPGVFSEDFAAPSALDSRHRGSVTSLASKKSTGHTSFAEELGLPSITEGLPSTSATAPSEPSENTANKTMELRRRAIQRQLRLLFIYPCVYMILWVIPFAMHCMNYTTYYAHHPIFALNVAQIFCMSIMTLVDVVIFSWREKPWRHIPGSDGTFWGSLCWWRFTMSGKWVAARKESRAPSFPEDAGEKEEQNSSQSGSGQRSNSQSGLLASIKRWSISIRGQSPRGSDAGGITAPPPSAATSRPTPHRRTFSGGSDRKHLEAERAHERLALERADFEQQRKSLNERRASVISGHSQPKREAREWFDREDGDLFEEEAERRGTV